ncbi:MAG TPA: T9SS type A sorting domain-containing protein [Puia sp.]|nr:T9SS type A sorting domain-containing protein [Puia sp.]
MRFLRAAFLFLSLFTVGVSNADAQMNLQMLIVGGGGGGGRNNGTNSSGGGGGGGGQVISATTTVPAGAVLNIVVGAGGNGYRYSPAVTQTNGGASSITFSSSTWSAAGGNAGTNATSSSSSGSGGTSVNSDGSGAGGRGGIYNNGNTVSGWPANGGNGPSSFSAWGAATTTGQLSGGTYYYGGGGAGGNWGGQLGSGVAKAGLGGGGLSNSDATANTGGGGGGANSNGHSGYDLPGGNGGSGIVIISYPGTPQATGGTVIQSGGNTYHVFTASGTFAAFAVLGTVWQSFKASNADGAIILDWTAFEASNNARYVIERSADGSDFQNIASVAAKAGGALQNYSYTDAHPMTGKTWYRIEQIAEGNRATYSKTLTVETRAAASEATIRFSPNPVHDRLGIMLAATTEGIIYFTVYNEGGAEVFRGRLYPGVNNIDMHMVGPGLYFVAISKNGRCIQVEKIVK